jgi:hypothetical protein
MPRGTRVTRPLPLVASVVAAAAAVGSPIAARAQPCAASGWQLVSPTGSGPAARAKAAIAFDAAAGRVLLFGGIGGSLRGDTWQWDGAAWSLAAATGPSPRQAAAMAFDSSRARAVLFGGNDGAARGDTWEWNGSAWSLRSPGGGAGSPSARYLHALAYDSARGRTVLFGGYDGALRADTWEWDGSAWSLRSAGAEGGAGGPSARYMHAMAYLPARGRTVLFGGYDGALRADTWEWDGSAWSLRSPGGGAASPSPRSGSAMAYSASRQRVVLFGGHDGAYRDDTWEWDGTAWTIRSGGSPSPGGRTFAALAHDAARRADVVFGGITGGTPPNYAYAGDTWAAADAVPAIVQQPASATVHAGQAATFTVVVSGAGPITYQWRKDGQALAAGERSLGTTTPTLTISPVMLALDWGQYDVVVSSPCGTAVSAAATLTVLCRPDFNGDRFVGPDDVSAFISAWHHSVRTGEPGGDFDRNLVVEPADVSAFVAAWMAALGGSCPP